jgi:hypothetical protein
MIEHLIWLHRTWAVRVSATGLALALFGVPVVAQSSTGTATDTYSWSAELVTLDETARTITLKAPIVASEVGDLSEFAAGDNVTLLWSGAYDYASGIRRVVGGGALENERFAMPVEFVAAELDGRYVSFRVTLPGAGVEQIKTLNPGDWVTATSPVAPAEQRTTLAAIRPYTTVS